MGKDLISLEDLKLGLKSLFFQMTNKCEYLISFIFELYDQDRKGKIDREDIKLIFSHLPLTAVKARALNSTKVKTLTPNIKQIVNQSNLSEAFISQVQAQEELHNYLEKVFGKERYLIKKKFRQIVKCVSSEIFLYVS